MAHNDIESITISISGRDVIGILQELIDTFSNQSDEAVILGGFLADDSDDSAPADEAPAAPVEDAPVEDAPADDTADSSETINTDEPVDAAPIDVPAPVEADEPAAPAPEAAPAVVEPDTSAGVVEDVNDANAAEDSVQVAGDGVDDDLTPAETAEINDNIGAANP